MGTLPGLWPSTRGSAMASRTWVTVTIWGEESSISEPPVKSRPSWTPRNSIPPRQTTTRVALT